MRLVLDTNVWLDWLVFRDARLQMLADAADRGQVRILATEAMLREFEAVVARPFFALDLQARQDVIAAVRSRIEPCADAPDCRLDCTDRADQMFIDLDVAHRVNWLLSRDKALLRLRRHAARRFAVNIGTPEHWVTAYDIDSREPHSAAGALDSLSAPPPPPSPHST
jgi:putative PIN family toxin of toxin-antitoxin system